MSGDLKIRIADVGISIEGDLQKSDWEIAPPYRPFISHGKTGVRLRLHRGNFGTRVGEEIFDCPPIWTLFRENGTSVIDIFPKMSGLERTLVLPRDLERADLYFAERSGRFNDPFYGPTMQLLMVNYLAAKGRGVIIHSCGIAMNGRGMLFVGESGAGKSTLARMWNHEDGVEVLSDDRTIVRKKGREFWMYGTPWHGEAKFGSPRGVRLERIFLIGHGRENSITDMDGIDPVSQLLTCSFSPHWDPQGMAFTLEILTDLTVQVPCQELTFAPDRRVTNFVEEIVT